MHTHTWTTTYAFQWGSTGGTGCRWAKVPSHQQWRHVLHCSLRTTCKQSGHNK
jgi:hypothetical protein